MAGNYSTVCRRPKTLKVRIPYRPAAQGLDLLVDSIGLKMMGEGEWKRKKHGAEYRRQGAGCTSGSMRRLWRSGRLRPCATQRLGRNIWMR
jgi:hypothetical protein